MDFVSLSLLKKHKSKYLMLELIRSYEFDGNFLQS